MLVSLRLDQFNNNHIKVGEKVENNIINNSYFLRINYNNSFCSINGIYLFFTLDDVKIRNTNFVKVGYYFDKIKNKSTIDNLISIENMKTDLIVTIGGDGTILKTCLRIPKPETPILAIDMGVRGFLTEIPPDKALQFVKKYLKGSYSIKNYNKLSSHIGKTKLPDALNEIYIKSQHLAKLLYLRVWKNDSVVTNLRADGVIVASQVGFLLKTIS